MEVASKGNTPVRACEGKKVGGRGLGVLREGAMEISPGEEDGEVRRGEEGYGLFLEG